MKRNLKFLASIAAAAALMVSAAGCSSSSTGSSESGSSASAETSSTEKTASEEQITIGILQGSEHEALDQCRQGFIDYLAENGYEDGGKVVFDYQNAQNDQSNLKTISQRFVNNECDYLLGISTPAAQTLATETQEIPIVGTAITDYVAAGLVDSDENPGGNVSGVNDATPIGNQIGLIKQLVPDAKTIGIMYNSSEVNSQVQAEQAQAEAEAAGYAVEISTVSSSNDVAQAMETMCEKVDAIYIPTDNTFASAMATVGQISEQRGVPVIPGDTGMCEAGGVATLGVDFYELGKQTGEFMLKVIDGGDISTMPVEDPKVNLLVINKTLADKIGIEIPQELLDSADSIV